eukprot:4218027-Ditylum_brightwellii.AAC.2
MNTSTSNYARRQLFRNQLNQKQCMIHNLVARSTLLPSGQSSTNGDSDVGILHLLLDQDGGVTADNYKNCAITGKA